MILDLLFFLFAHLFFHLVVALKKQFHLWLSSFSPWWPYSADVESKTYIHVHVNKVVMYNVQYLYMNIVCNISIEYHVTIRFWVHCTCSLYIHVAMLANFFMTTTIAIITYMYYCTTIQLLSLITYYYYYKCFSSKLHVHDYMYMYIN